VNEQDNTASEALLKSRAAKLRLDERLDEALKETFPASDPIAVHEPRVERGASGD
jgi:hypothetical protein